MISGLATCGASRLGKLGQIVDKVADAADAVETARATADIVANGANVGNIATVAGAAIGAGSRAANRASNQASGSAQAGRNRVDEALDDLESGRRPRRDNPDRPNPCAALGALDHAAAHAATGGDCPNPNLPPHGETLDSGDAQFAAPKKVGGPEAVHKNSLEYVGDSHVYRISGPEGTYKIGESSQGIRARDGASIRGEKQARRLSRETGDYFVSEILRIFEDKSSARDYETRLIERFRSLFGNDALPGYLNRAAANPPKHTSMAISDPHGSGTAETVPISATTLVVLG